MINDDFVTTEERQARTSSEAALLAQRNAPPAESKTLRERIAQELEEQERQNARDAEIDFKGKCNALAQTLLDTLGIEAGEFVGEFRPETIIEGMRFSFHSSDYGPVLVLVRSCPHCGKDEDFVVRSLASLGRQLEANFSWPHSNAQCTEQTGQTFSQPQTVEARLIEALRDYIAECVSQIG